MIDEKKVLNHHSGVLLPYGFRKDGRVYFVLEEKSADYKPPFFDRGLNFLGGNSVPGERSPEDIVRREIEEEFWCRVETPEDLNRIMGEEFLAQRPEIAAKYDAKSVERIQGIGRLILDGIRHQADYRISVSPPITREHFVWGNTIFTRELTEEQLNYIGGEIDVFGGKLTTDNLKRDSRVVVVSLDDVNGKNLKFAWGYDHIITDVMKSIDPQHPGVIRPLRLASMERIELPSGVERTASGGPTFEGFKRSGFSYKSL